MHTPKTLKALLLSALVATATTLPTASAAEVYFENDSGASGVVASTLTASSCSTTCSPPRP